MTLRTARHNRLLDSSVVTALPPIVAFLLFLYQAFKCCRDSRFFVDDPFITMRFAANLMQYGELFFNPGIVVEGYSNLLLVRRPPRFLSAIRGSSPSLFRRCRRVAESLWPCQETRPPGRASLKTSALDIARCS